MGKITRLNEELQTLKSGATSIVSDNRKSGSTYNDSLAIIDCENGTILCRNRVAMTNAEMGNTDAMVAWCYGEMPVLVGVRLLGELKR